MILANSSWLTAIGIIELETGAVTVRFCTPVNWLDSNCCNLFQGGLKDQLMCIWQMLELRHLRLIRTRSGMKSVWNESWNEQNSNSILGCLTKEFINAPTTRLTQLASSKDTSESNQRTKRHWSGPFITRVPLRLHFVVRYRLSCTMSMEFTMILSAQSISFNFFSSWSRVDWICILVSDIMSHSAVIVGYGTLVNNGTEVPYWLCKNSWSDGWGEAGFFKIVR